MVTTPATGTIQTRFMSLADPLLDYCVRPRAEQSAKDTNRRDSTAPPMLEAGRPRAPPAYPPVYRSAKPRGLDLGTRGDSRVSKPNWGALTASHVSTNVERPAVSLV